MSACRKFSDEYVYKLRAENEELLGEVLELRRSLRIDIDILRVDSYKARFGLPAVQARILALLIDRDFVSFSEICDLLPNQDSFLQKGTARQHISRIRAALRKLNVDIENLRGQGYRLPQKAKDQIREGGSHENNT